MRVIEEQNILKALRILERCGFPKPPGASAEMDGEGGQCDAGAILIERLTALVDSHLDSLRRFEMMRKELGVFSEVNSDANNMLERKIEEISLLRLITDANCCALGTQDPLKLIMEKVASILGAENGSIMLINGDVGRLDVRAASGPGNLDPEGAFFKLAHGVATRTIAEGEPIFIDAVNADSEFCPGLDPEEARAIGSFASFPLMIENKTIGVLNLNSPYPNAFGTETLRIMLIIAGQIAVAAENVRLYGEAKKTKEYLENLVERAGDGIFTLDREHNILSWNAGAESIFSLKKPDVEGNTLYMMLPESMQPTLRDKIQSIFDSGNVITIESDLKNENNGPTRVTITLSPIHGAEGEVAGVSGIAKDMTKRRRMEDELRELNAAKSNFVSTVSHELRTPLTSIKSLTELLSHERASLSEENIEKYLEIINGECDRLSDLISSLLDLQKLSAGKLEVDFKEVRMAEIVGRVVELFDGVALQNKVELVADLAAPDELTVVMGDRGQLSRIISNLLSNAIKYSYPGDRVIVRVLRCGEDIEISVIDSGCGIPDKEKGKIFEKFYRLDGSDTRNKGGTGLGLAITKELVTLHGGSIWVEDGQGRGSCFKTRIPAAHGG